VIKISLDSVVTQTVLDGLTAFLPVANFLQYVICAKTFESWLAVDKVIAIVIRLTFLCFETRVL